MGSHTDRRVLLLRRPARRDAPRVVFGPIRARPHPDPLCRAPRGVQGRVRPSEGLDRRAAGARHRRALRHRRGPPLGRAPHGSDRPAPPTTRAPRRRRERLRPRESLTALSCSRVSSRANSPGNLEAVMAEAYIVDAVRTPVGRRNGGLAEIHSADLGAHPITQLVERTGVDPAAIDDVIYGCLDQIGPQSGDVARTCALVAGLPESVPGTTIDRQCGSSQQAIHFGAQAIMAGSQDLVIAGGVQNMSQIPIGASMTAAKEFGHPSATRNSPGWQARYGGERISQFRGAELIAEKWGLSRDDME